MDKALEQALRDGRGVRVTPLARALGVSAVSLYAAVKREEVPATRIGQRIIITAPVARKLLGIETEAA